LISRIRDSLLIIGICSWHPAILQAIHIVGGHLP
jgi:hypothetical protein